jgi:hypothetical protein
VPHFVRRNDTSLLFSPMTSTPCHRLVVDLLLSEIVDDSIGIVVFNHSVKVKALKVIQFHLPTRKFLVILLISGIRCP